MYDYTTTTVSGAEAFALAHAEPIDADWSDDEPRCYCYNRYGELQYDPCGYCEHLWEVEQMYGPVPPEPTEGDTMPNEPDVDLLLLAIHNADLSDEVLFRLAHCYASVRPDNPTAARYLVLAPLLVKATMLGDSERMQRITDELTYTPGVTA